MGLLWNVKSGSLKLPSNIKRISNIKRGLLIFADSSSKAYGCAAYFRFVKKNKAKVSFVIGKSRLAPYKEIRLSISKLELQAAVTATRIKTKLLEQNNFDVKGFISGVIQKLY